MLDFSFYEKMENRSIPKSAKAVLDYFEAAEKKLLSQPGGERFCDDGVPFLELADGWFWFKVDEGFSTQEAHAMRHCGNGIGSDGDVLLSLREPVCKGNFKLWKPHLTFILNEGYLGEMKGFANQKPASRFHPYIEELLGHDMVKGIRGGGFLPISNFSFMDFETSAQTRILEKRPDFEFDMIPSEEIRF